MFLDGVQKTLTFTGTIPATTTTSSGVAVGALYSYAVPMVGLVRNVLIYNRALNSTERQDVEAWMGY